MDNYPNIILIVFDTLRKDILPPYGGDASTPFLNTFVKDSVVYQNAIAPSPWTVPSHSSFLTGYYPNRHGIHENFENKNLVKTLVTSLAKNYPNLSLVKYLNNYGYNTFGFSSNPWLSPETGFDKGFKNFTYFAADYVTFEDEELLAEYKKYGENRYEAFKNLILKGKINEVLKYYGAYRKIMKEKFKIGGHPFKKGADQIVNTIYHSSFERPYFMFLNFMEVHEPVTKWESKALETTITQYLDLFGRKEISRSRINQIFNGYKLALSNLDHYFGKFIQYLKSNNQYDDSLIIVISDHGQAIKERNYYGHGNFLYDEIIEVPFIVKYPKGTKIVDQKGYQSLVKIPQLMRNVIDDGSSGDISDDVVFSEAYGFVHNIEKVLRLHKLFKGLNVEELKRKYGYPKEAVYKNGYKLVINGLNGDIDEFSYKKKNLSPSDNKEILKDLVNELYSHDKETFVLPEIK